MHRLTELLQKRAKLIADARKIMDGENPSAEDLARADRMMDDADAMEDDVKRAERLITQERREAARVAPPGTGSPADPGSGAEDGDAPSEADLRMLGFRSYLSGTPFSDMDAEQVQAVRAISAGTDAQGGYLVAPEQFVRDLIKEIDDLVFMRQLCTVRNVTESDKLGVPSLDADPSDPTWTTEIETGAEDNAMRTGKREFEPQPLAKRIKVSRKLIRASMLPVEQIVRERLARVQGYAQEKAYLTGDGANKPLGIFTVPGGGNGALPLTRDISADNTNTAITADGLINAQFHLKGGYRAQASWMFHRDGVRNIRKLKDSTGQYIWQPSLIAGEPSMLLGNPVYESEFVPNTFTTGKYVGIFAAWKYYWIVDALDMQIQRLVELYAETNQIGYITRSEHDGMHVIDEAFVRVALT